MSAGEKVDNLIGGEEGLYKSGSLEKTSSTVDPIRDSLPLVDSKRYVAHASALVLLAAGLFLLSPNITGNAIGNLPVGGSNFVGIVSIILGIVLGVLVLRRK